MWKNESMLLLLNNEVLYIQILRNNKRKPTINYIYRYLIKILFILVTHNIPFPTLSISNIEQNFVLSYVVSTNKSYLRTT